MSTKDFTANVISASKVVPDGNFKDSKASGIWDINEALDLIKGGNWPNVANFNPASFVDALFQCHLWDGSGSSRSITNNINLSGSGGLVWYKGRDTGGQGATQRHSLYDTERGVTKRLISNENHAESTEATGLTAFNTTGFTIGGDAETNQSNYDYVSWTFREQPKFFDIVKYEGTGSDRTVAHSLGTTVGMIIIKNLDQTDNWAVYHREAYDQNAGADYVLHLNTNSARTNSSDYFNDTAPTSSVFTVGTDHTVNASGENYIAYLFAHNNDDGGFGEPGDQDIIKCGSVLANGSGNFTESLGFEPQFILFKAVNQAEGWEIFDGIRNLTAVRFYNTGIEADSNAAEGTGSKNLQINADGFTSTGGVSNDITYIYMAIRRGGMQTPTAASSVFTVDDGMAANTTSVPGFTANHVVDLGLSTTTSSASRVLGTRLLGPTFLTTDATDAETANNVCTTLGYQNGFFFTNGSADSTRTGWMWARARGYFDAVAYTGTGSARTVSHNLGVAPEMMWVKRRNSAVNWAVYHKGLNGGTTPENYKVFLNLTNAEGTGSNIWNDTAPTSSVFTVATSTTTNNSSGTYIAYLFATVANVSKVGSFTQSGATNVACGFTGDTPSFILLKRTDDTGNWYFFDSVRGIVAGNDPHWYLDTTDAEITNADLVDPYSGGFATTSSLTDGDYIFYAIAATS